MHERVKNPVCSANEIADKIIIAADQNEINCEDDTCLLAYSILRDCGYQIKRILHEEVSQHNNC